MIPSVGFRRSDGNTGAVRPGNTGILALIAAATTGTQNVAAGYTRPQTIQTEKGYGRLASFGAYAMATSKNPILAVRPTTATAGAYGTFTNTGAGTATPAAGGTEPNDDFDAYVIFGTGGALGTTGITYQTSLDGGATLSPVKALGTALNIVIANTGVTIVLGTSSQTILAAQTIAFKTTGPLPTTSDLTAAYEALRVTGSAWEAALVDGIGSSAHVSQMTTWLDQLEAIGKFRTAVLNLRFRNVGETDADYATAMAAIVNSVADPRVVVCGDGGDSVDFFQGVKLRRPAALAVAARGMKIDISEDPAYAASGALDNWSIQDARSNPKYHNEALNPGLDDLRITALRTFEGDAGAYINNANLLSAAGSDFVYWQHMRLLQRACEIAWQILRKQLSVGVRKSTKVGPNGERYIDPVDAGRIEKLVNAAFTQPFQGRVNDVLFSLSRDDDISSNTGATISGTIGMVALAYVKKYDITDKFVKEISVAAAA